MKNFITLNKKNKKKPNLKKMNKILKEKLSLLNG